MLLGTDLWGFATELPSPRPVFLGGGEGVEDEGVAGGETGSVSSIILSLVSPTITLASDQPTVIIYRHHYYFMHLLLLLL